MTHSPPPLEPTSLDRRAVGAALFVGLGALLLRLLYIAQVRDIALFAVPLADARAYLDWAGGIAAGDVWSRSIGVFYQAPLYPYLLAVVQWAVGEAGAPPDRTLLAVRLLQAGFGAASCGLLTLAGTRLVDRASGVAAGLLLAAYPPAIFFDGLINKTSLALLLLCLLLLTLTEASVRRERPASVVRRLALATGIVLGLLSLTRENALLLVPVLGLWWLVDPTRRRKAPVTHRTIAQTVAFALGLGLVLLPIAVRNLVVGDTFAVTTAQSGPNFYIGNRAGATGSYTPLRRGRSDPRFERRDAVELAEADLGRRLGRALTPGEVSAYWWSRARDEIRDEPGAWLRLLGRKGALVVHRYEMPDIEDYELMVERSALLRALAPWLHWGVLLPLAVAGLVLTWELRGRWLPLALVAATLAAGIVLFFVFARYRFPLVPLAALAAGAGVVRLAGELRRQTSGDVSWTDGPRRLLLAVVAAAATAAVAHWPLSGISGPEAEARRAMVFVNLGAALVEQDRYDDAAVEYHRAVALDGDLVEARLNLGSLLVVRGRPEDGLPHLEAAARLAPRDAEIHHQIGQAWREIARRRGPPGAFEPRALAAARRSYRRALEIEPGFEPARRDLAALPSGL